MSTNEVAIARKAKAMTRREIVMRAAGGVISWETAALILRLSERHMRRIRDKYEQFGVEALEDGRAGRPRARRVSLKTVAEVCRLKQDVYADFSMKHFHEVVTEKHKLSLSYTLLRSVLQDAGLVEKAPGRGKYRRKRERRPMVGMLIHMDASTHEWIAGLPMQDLVVVLDDADGRMLFARFVEQEGTRSTFEALYGVLRRFGRFCEFYTDRGSHFCRTPKAGGASETDGQVSRALRVLGIRQILARSPQARGRSERAFGTIQGRLPQELRVEGVRSYAEANKYLERVFMRDFNKRFTVVPTESGSAFVPLAGIDLDLVLSEKYERVVGKDCVVSFETLSLQLPAPRDRASHARCAVTVHRLVDGTLAVAWNGQELARFSAAGALLREPRRRRERAA
jgi:transposase